MLNILDIKNDILLYIFDSWININELVRFSLCNKQVECTLKSFYSLSNFVIQNNDTSDNCIKWLIKNRVKFDTFIFFSNLDYCYTYDKLIFFTIDCWCNPNITEVLLK